MRVDEAAGRFWTCLQCSTVIKMQIIAKPDCSGEITKIWCPFCKTEMKVVSTISITGVEGK